MYQGSNKKGEVEVVASDEGPEPGRGGRIGDGEILSCGCASSNVVRVRLLGHIEKEYDKLQGFYKCAVHHMTGQHI